MSKRLKLINIGTTAYSEENLSIITDLTKKEVIKVIEPIVLAERNEESEYDNDDLVKALKKKYPTAIVKDVSDPLFIEI